MESVLPLTDIATQPCDMFGSFEDFLGQGQDTGLRYSDFLLDDPIPIVEGYLGTFDQVGTPSYANLAEVSPEPRVNPSDPTPLPKGGVPSQLLPVGAEDPDLAGPENTDVHPAEEQRSASIPELRASRKSEPKICKDYSKRDCLKSFTNQKHLDAHIQKVHKIIPYKCDNIGCSRSASRLDNLKAHLKKCPFGSKNKKRTRAPVSPPSPPDDSQPPQPKRQRTDTKHLPTSPPKSTQCNSAGNSTSYPAGNQEAIDIDGLLTPPSSQKESPSTLEISYCREADPVILENSPTLRISELENQVKLLKGELEASKRQTAEFQHESQVWRKKFYKHRHSCGCAPSK